MLHATKLKTLKPGRHGDGGGLYLAVTEAGTRSWLFRYMIAGRSHQMGLGGLATVGLADARDRARDARALLARGIDPLDQRASQAASGHTFKDAAERCIADRKSAWRSAKHGEEWTDTLTKFAFPVIGDKPMDQITVGDVVMILRPIWVERTETASRLRSRIEIVLSYGKAMGWRSGENVATWKDNIAAILPSPRKIRTVPHHPALPWQMIPSFMAELRQLDGTAALALELCIVTAVRSGVVLKAQWPEIAGDIWIVPGAHEKSGAELRVPLSGRALAILAELRQYGGGPDDYVIPGRAGRPVGPVLLSQTLRYRMARRDITVHGFRSSFRDWVGEATNHSSDVAEAALSHKFTGVRAAYQRGSLLQKRRVMMADWAAYCAGEMAETRKAA